MWRDKENYFLLSFGTFLVITVFILSYLAFQAGKLPATLQKSLPQPVPEVLKEIPDKSQAAGAQTTFYDVTATNRLVQKLSHPTPLSDTDNSVKESLLSKLSSSTSEGIIYITGSSVITYLPSPGVFLVQILTIDTRRAKAETNGWFLDQGLSQAGICDIPIVFYLTERVSLYLRDNNIPFNPLAPGC